MRLGRWVPIKNRYLSGSLPHFYDTQFVPYHKTHHCYETELLFFNRRALIQFPHFSTMPFSILPCKVILDVTSSYFSPNL